MRAVTIVGGGIEVREQPEPQVGFGQVLLAVRAAGINGADVHQMVGRYPAIPGLDKDRPGLEVAGEVIAVGPGAYRFGVGARVMALVSGEAQAERCVVHEREAMPVPDSLDWDAAGGLPEAFITAHDAVFTQGRLLMGQRLCVHGGAGGVGTAAVQLAVAAGAEVVASVRSPGVKDRVAQLGATVIDAADTVAHGPFDVVLELVSGANLSMSLASIVTGGRVVIVGVSAAPTAELDFRALMRTRARILGSALRSRPLEQKADAARRLEDQVLPGFASGALTVPIHAQFPLARAAEAYDCFTGAGKFGKVVLTVE